MELISTELTELLDMISETNKIGTKASTLNETADSYIVNSSPTEQSLSPLPVEFPNTAHSKLKRKAPETAARDRGKKRETDKAYRQRCKEKKMKTEQDLVVLIEENNTLKKENVDLKKEVVKQHEMVETQKEKIKLLQNERGRLKAQLQKQNVVVEVLSKQVASGKNNMDLQCENKQLKLDISLLIKKININDDLNLILLQEKTIKLEQEKNDLQVIVDALCAKINKDKDDVEPRQAF